VSTDSDQLARLRVAAETGHFPRDLAEWTLATVARGLIELRNERIVAAVRRLYGPSLWWRCGRFLQLVDQRHESVAELLELPLPRSHRHIYRIVADALVSRARSQS
jgi:hypothetical protein